MKIRDWGRVCVHAEAFTPPRECIVQSIIHVFVWSLWKYMIYMSLPSLSPRPIITCLIIGFSSLAMSPNGAGSNQCWQSGQLIFCIDLLTRDSSQITFLCPDSPEGSPCNAPTRLVLWLQVLEPFIEWNTVTTLWLTLPKACLRHLWLLLHYCFYNMYEVKREIIHEPFGSDSERMSHKHNVWAITAT